LYSTLLQSTLSLKLSDIAHVSWGITQFHLPPMHKPYLPLGSVKLRLGLWLFIPYTHKHNPECH